MQNYAEMTTAELIDLLFKEEDRVTEDHFKELAGRGEEVVARMREILANEDYWYEGQGGEHFIVVHAVNLLGALRDEPSIPLFLQMLEHAYFANHDWGCEVYPPALAEFGEAGVEPFIQYIRDHRGAHRDNQDWAHCRQRVAAALTRIALHHDAAHDRVRDFILEQFNDPAEDDFVFLSNSAAYPFLLGRKRGVEALRTAYNRRALAPSLVGSQRELMAAVNNPTSNLYHDLQTELLDFYQPEQMKLRAEQRAKAAEQKLYWGYDDASVPKGYAVGESGNVVRTDKVGRNDPCICGSGKKYKKCCGQ
jgi:hypothetical protein